MDSVQVGQSAPGIRSDRTYTPREVLWSENGAQLPARRRHSRRQQGARRPEHRRSLDPSPGHGARQDHQRRQVCPDDPWRHHGRRPLRRHDRDRFRRHRDGDRAPHRRDRHQRHQGCRPAHRGRHRRRDCRHALGGQHDHRRHHDQRDRRRHRDQFADYGGGRQRNPQGNSQRIPALHGR
jgi:hypothetical protein